MVAAINSANGSGGGTITLAGGCTYTLVAPTTRANGLPVITATVTIQGNGATITRASSAPSFRILGVASGGTLTLNALTISGENRQTARRSAMTLVAAAVSIVSARWRSTTAA